MQKFAASLTGLMLTICSLSAQAESAVRVQALNYPAWLVRNYQTLPLQPGTLLQNDDLIRTGEGGRVKLQLADGNVLNLGGSSRFVIENASGDTADSISLQILRGVFRITPADSASTSPRHRLEISAGAISASLRNAAIWGRADLAQDAVCLVDGEIAVEAADADRVQMTQALSCYVKPRDQAPLPVDLIDIQQHQLWMAETELMDDAGIATADGQWQLVLISLTDAKSAAKMLAGFHQRGFGALDKTVVRQERVLHRLLLPGFVSIDAALNARARVEQALGVSETWVWKANQD